MIFASKFSEIFVELGPFSGQSFKICPKWLFYLGPNIILEKVRKFENIWIIPWEMAADLLSVGWIPPPTPASFRVKRQISWFGLDKDMLYIIFTGSPCWFQPCVSWNDPMGEIGGQPVLGHHGPSLPACFGSNERGFEPFVTARTGAQCLAYLLTPHF